MSYHENHVRSIYKAISYRILSITIDSVFVYGITGKPKTTLGIVLATNFYSTFVYYAHERVWNHFHFGKKSLRRASDATSAKKKSPAKKAVRATTKKVAITETKKATTKSTPQKKAVRKTATSKQREAIAVA